MKRRTPPRAVRRRIRVAVIYGGRSVEHEVSLVSARAIIGALDPRRYEVVPILVRRDGRFEAGGLQALTGDPAGFAGLLPARRAGRGPSRARTVDVAFPIVHGTGGEDGALQGLLTTAGLPFVGAGVLGSALGMDKAVMKSMFHQAGLPVVRYRVFDSEEFEADPQGAAERAAEACGYPCFVKPANGGSSVGVSKAKERGSLLAALRLAFRYDHKVIVETGVDAREIECSVLGHRAPEVSVAGEIVPAGEFYDYASKYQDEGSRLVIPAPLEAEERTLVRDIAARAFRVLDLSGMARVDFFLDRRSGALYLNEVNTLPGFTPISMYPKLWEASGLAFPDLVDRLVRLAIERHRERARLVTTFEPGRREARDGGRARRRA